MQTTIDGLLDKRVALEQPATGYRVAVDTVLLAAAVPARAGERVLDLGCGVGGAMLCLACRVPRISVLGIDIQRDLTLLCRDNIMRNQFNADLKVQMGDATKLSPALTGYADHVMMNPPYHDEARHDVSHDAQKRTANTERDGDLALWIGSAAQALKNSGILTLIHRTDRLEEIIAQLQKYFGAITVLPILPKPNAAPKRVIIRAAKGGVAAVTHCSGFVLHRPDGGYSDAAESILRHAKALEFSV